MCDESWSRAKQMTSRTPGRVGLTRDLTVMVVSKAYSM